MSDELRELFESAHRADEPESFSAVLGKRPRAQRSWPPPVSIPVTVTAIALIAFGVALSRSPPRPRPPPLPIAENGLVQTPLDFLLLQPQGQKLFSEIPRFDMRGLP